MPSFSETISAVRQGVQGATTSGAVSNIEGWQDTLSGLDSPEAQAINDDLETLKTHLQADTLDGEAISSLLAKLGQETMAISRSAGGANAAEIEELGQALTDAADSGGASTA